MKDMKTLGWNNALVNLDNWIEKVVKIEYQEKMIDRAMKAAEVGYEKAERYVVYYEAQREAILAAKLAFRKILREMAIAAPAKENKKQDELKKEPYPDAVDNSIVVETAHDYIEKSCDNCQLKARGECSPFSKILCEDYRAIPYVTEDEKINWPKEMQGGYGDRTLR